FNGGKKNERSLFLPGERFPDHPSVGFRFVGGRIMHKSILSFLFITLCAVATAFAQGGTGQLSGNVVDVNGAVVNGASVKLTSLVTAQERETVTNDSGD